MAFGQFPAMTMEGGNRGWKKAMARKIRIVLGGSAIAAAVAMAAPAAAAECGDLAQMAVANGKVTAATVVAPGAFRQPAAPGGPPPGVGGGAYSRPVAHPIQPTDGTR
jgi:hypothetical protein